MKKTIFFDWDGTLVSTKISEIANVSRTKVICEDIDEKELLNLQRNNGENHYSFIQSLIRKETGIENEDEIKRIQVYLFSFFYLKCFRKNPNDYLIVDLEELKELKKKYNLQFIIITSLFKEIISGCLKAIDPEKEIFDDYYGIESNLEGEKKDFISNAIKKYHNSKPLIMIGDKEGDILPGEYHNLKTIFCNYGHGSVDSATITIEKPEDLISAIKKLI